MSTTPLMNNTSADGTRLFERTEDGRYACKRRIGSRVVPGGALHQYKTVDVVTDMADAYRFVE